jgi:hypothetical protein
VFVDHLNRQFGRVELKGDDECAIMDVAVTLGLSDWKDKKKEPLNFARCMTRMSSVSQGNRKVLAVTDKSSSKPFLLHPFVSS